MRRCERRELATVRNGQREEVKVGDLGCCHAGVISEDVSERNIV